MEHKLPTELKERWTTALRSGEYKQGRSVLRDDSDRYCCLGVLANICGLQWIPAGGDYATPVRNADGYSRQWISGSELLPPPVKAALNQLHEHRRVEVALADMNDSGSKFPAIADWIDHNL